MIDNWLLTKKHPNFNHLHTDTTRLIQEPSASQLLTAGFPNVLLIVLPKDEVQGAMDLARRMLTGESSEVKSPWLELANQIKAEVFGHIPVAASVWEEYLKAQWQIYWTALPLGENSEVLARPNNYQAWKDKQNKFVGLSKQDGILTQEEEVFFKPHQVNIGSWWAPAFDRIRFSLTAVKNARIWELPTAFGSRSTISGIGSIVRREAENDWIYSDDTDPENINGVSEFWAKRRGLFDGKEQLNATEAVKRGLRKVLPRFISFLSDSIPAYPDLSVGVAGWLKQYPQEISKYQQVCEDVMAEFAWADEAAKERWGIPWVDENEEHQDWQHPRLINAGWLMDDYLPHTANSTKPLTRTEKQTQIKKETSKLRSFITQKSCFPNGNPTDWYVLAVGDGDDMGGWLKGTKMRPYQQYVPSGFPRESPPSQAELEALNAFLLKDKRMGPATHAALSRALLDFSNQLVPYLTEKRYAGHLIYSGGDDVLAYTNLWEWDSWLWDVSQCFRGGEDPKNEFDDTGDYWRWQQGNPPENVAARPLFTMGGNASISFGVIIAHHSVPLAIALENLWTAEKEGAKKHKSPQGNKKDAVQVRVLYSNGNILKSTSKFNVFSQWKELLNFKRTHPQVDFDPALFEQAAEIWKQHPVPFLEGSDEFAAIATWTTAFCDRRDLFKGEDKAQAKEDFQQALANYLKALCETTQAEDRDREVQAWLKLAAFVLRKRDIKIGGV